MESLRHWRPMAEALAIASCLSVHPFPVGTASAQQAKPNIVFILGDNIGYGDIGVYGGGELRGSPTPRIDQLALEGLRLTQFLVEPSCTPSRAALMTGRYSIRSGLSLIAVAGTDISLPANEITMAEMLHDAGYATAIFGKWHLGAQTYSQPQNQGFDEFYGIPPGDTWDAFGMIRQGKQTDTLDIPLDKGPQIVEANRGEPLKSVKPYTEEVRRGIDWELVDHGVAFMKRQKAAGKPFFLYLPISRTHYPNLPSKRFEGASRIGQFGDSLMEGDAIVGTMLDAVKELGAEENTIVVVASDNGPDGPGVIRFGADMPDMGASGPYRGALGEVSEGAIRTAAIIRWPHRIKPRSSYAMFSIMDFFPTFAHIAGGKVPDDRPIDGVDQSKFLLGEDDTGARQHLLTFVGSELVAARWKQFRAYFADVAPGRSGAGGATLMGGVGASAAPMNGYPQVFNIEADPQEEHNIGAMYDWVLGPILKTVEEYKETLVRSPNPPAANMTKF
ncbi:arylsulfatase [Rhizobium sp. 3T7]|uniref:arylsulfatase n=1 Tax=Rhizobium sp. 3T7 TaxID=2874922 RepID=UPI001CCA7FCC|nr:arylsulfatase [Rhizobium sp. 3T7]MBZ9790316.1 arylsulfatase [Rhizobium sp. 3T7]